MAEPERLSLEDQLEELLGAKPTGKIATLTYDDYLEFFRKIPAGRMMKAKDWLTENLSVEGFAAASRWIEIISNPTRMDKLYQGRLQAKQKESIMDLAIGEDDEAFYEALIRENVAKLDESRNSAQEVARITQNLNIFRKQLREIRSRKPKKGSVLQQVLEAAKESPKVNLAKPKKTRITQKKKETKNGKRKAQANGQSQEKSKVSGSVQEDRGEQEKAFGESEEAQKIEKTSKNESKEENE